MAAADAGDASPTRPGADLRLVVAAVAAWLSTLGLLGQASRPGYAVGVCCGLLALGGLRVRRRWAAVAVVVLGSASAGALATAVRVAAVDASPLAGLAQVRASATLEAVVRDDPRLLSARGPNRGPRVAVRVRVSRVAAGGRAWRVADSVLVLAPANGWADLLPSQKVTVDGRLAPPSRRDLSAAVLSARGRPVAVGAPSRVQRAAAHVRAGLRTAAEVLPERARGLLPGLVVGDVVDLDPVLAEDFRDAGMSHLLAVSGTNFSIVLGAVLLALRAVSVGPRTSAVLAGIALAGFVVLARPTPSVLRAAVMGGVVLLALATGRQRSALPALGGAVLLLVLAKPSLAPDAGFALSVLATAALIVIAPGWAAGLRRRGVPVGVAEALAVPAAAAVATAPVVVAIAGEISLVTVPANLLAAPAVAPATVLGLLAAVAAPIWAPAATALAWLAGLPIGWLVVVAGHAARVPAGVLTWPGGAAGGFALVAVVLVCAVALRWRAVRRGALALVVGLVLVGMPVQAIAPSWPPAGWIFVACDVGQGDALVVRAGTDEGIVVDAGPEPVAVDRCLTRLGVRRVPLLLITHLHADHVGGLRGVLGGRAVGAVEVGPLREPQSGWLAVREEVRRRALPLWQAAPGERRVTAGVEYEVIGPAAPFTGTRSDPNNSSVVIKVRTQHHTLLLTGDVETEAQEAMIRSGADVRADVLKVPHHGSAWQFPPFLAAVHASVGITSVGKDNDYGHPSPLLLAELARLGLSTARTDENGDVAVCDDHGRLTIATRSGRPP